jgi:hypothetical protein
MTDRTETITEGELNAALSAVLGHKALAGKAVLDHITANRDKAPTPDSITASELLAALKRATVTYSYGSGIGLSYGKYRTPEQLADAILADARDHREPEYAIGGVYKSATDTYYKRVLGGWFAFGGTTLFDDSYPQRPLVRVDK